MKPLISRGHSRSDDDFWSHLDAWRSLLKKRLRLTWGDGWLENAWCAECRYCCGPQGDDAPFPMALLPGQVGPQTKNDFYMLNQNTAYIGKDGCKSDTPNGCRLSRLEKPVACGLFPIVLANGKLYLYVMCPASLAVPLVEFFEFAKEAAEFLRGFNEAELRHISIDLECGELSEKFIDLHCRLFG